MYERIFEMSALESGLKNAKQLKIPPSIYFIMHHIETVCMPAPPLSGCPLCIPYLVWGDFSFWTHLLFSKFSFSPLLFRISETPNSLFALFYVLFFFASKRWRQTEATSNCAKKGWKFVCVVVGVCVCQCNLEVSSANLKGGNCSIYIKNLLFSLGLTLDVLTMNVAL